MNKFNVKDEKDKSYENTAKFIAIVPWMMEHKFKTPDSLYIFGYVWNCVNHFGQFRMHYKSDAVRCSMYVGVDEQRFLDAINDLIDDGCLDTLHDNDGITYLYPLLGKEKLPWEYVALEDDE